jgi:hypothetical protein
MGRFCTGSSDPLPLADLTLSKPRVCIIEPGLSATLNFIGAGHNLTIQILTSNLGIHIAIHVLNGPFAEHQSVTKEPHGTAWRPILARILSSMPPCIRLQARDGGDLGMSVSPEYYFSWKCILTGSNIPRKTGYYIVSNDRFILATYTTMDPYGGIVESIREYIEIKSISTRELTAVAEKHAAELANITKSHTAELTIIMEKHAARAHELEEQCQGAEIRIASAEAEREALASRLTAAVAAAAAADGAARARAAEYKALETENAQLREHVRQSALAMSLLQRPRGMTVPDNASSSGIPDDVSAVHTVRAAPEWDAGGSWGGVSSPDSKT